MRDLHARRCPNVGDYDATTDARTRPDQEAAQRVGRRHLDPGRTVRDDRGQEGGSDLRDHDPPDRVLHARIRASPTWCSATPSKAICRGVTSRSTPMALELTTGAPHAGRPVRWRGRPPRQAAAHPDGPRGVRSPTTRCGCCARPGSSSGLQLVPDAELVGAVRERCTPGSRSCRPNGSATSSTSCSLLDRPSRWPVVLRRHRAGVDVPARVARHAARTGSDPSAQGRARPHPGRGRERAARCQARLRLPDHAAGGAVPRRRQAAHPRVPQGHRA